MGGVLTYIRVENLSWAQVSKQVSRHVFISLCSSLWKCYAKLFEVPCSTSFKIMNCNLEFEVEINHVSSKFVRLIIAMEMKIGH